jgi:hypothetical protein
MGHVTVFGPLDQSKTSTDRDRIREILIAAGAPTRDLEWMVASCPDESFALAYRPYVLQRKDDK